MIAVNIRLLGTAIATQIAHDTREVIYSAREVIYTKEVIYTREVIYPSREVIYPTRATTDLGVIDRLIGKSNDVNEGHAHHRVKIIVSDVNWSRLRPLHVLKTDVRPFLNILGHEFSLQSAQHHWSRQYLSLAIIRICFRKATRP